MKIDDIKLIWKQDKEFPKGIIADVSPFGKYSIYPTNKKRTRFCVNFISIEENPDIYSESQYCERYEKIGDKYYGTEDDSKRVCLIHFKKMFKKFCEEKILFQIQNISFEGIYNEQN